MSNHDYLQQTKTLLSQLVAFPVLGGQSNLSIANFIGACLDQAGIPFHKVDNEEGTKTAIHCRIGPALEGGIILSGHMDVVPTEGQAWDTDPFQLTTQGERWYGRGATDMKGFIACCLALLPEMTKANLKRPIYFAFSYDEEIGCRSGALLAMAIREHYIERPAFAIIGEPTEMQTVTAEKGMGVFETSVFSRAGHSSQVRNGASAVQEAAKLALWLENKMEALIAAGHTDDRFSPNHSTLQAGIFKGGIAPNIIADYCHLEWDLRIIPTDDWQAILSDFEQYCRERQAIIRAKVPEFKIETVPQYPFVPALNTPSNASIVDFTNSLNGQNQTGSASFASEAGQFAEAGFEAVLCGPGSVEQCHIANEYVDIRQIEKCLHFIEKLVVTLSK